jgi:hypothetical protein
MVKSLASIRCGDAIMSKLNLSVDEVLSTTRAVRNCLDFDRPGPYALILDIPYADYIQVALVPFAFTRGAAFKPAPRKAVDQFIHRNGW